MDRRTIIVVIAMTFVLFSVNYYFTSQHQAEVAEWNMQQKALKEAKQQKLEEEVQQKTAKVSQLPFITLYADSAAKTSVGNAIIAGKTLLTIASSEKMPENVYATVDGKLDGFRLLTANPTLGGPVVYARNPDETVTSTSLPHFGTYQIQLAALPSTTVTFAQYVDGQFEIPSQELTKIINELEGTKEPIAVQPSSIALFKSEKGYLPVGWYNAEEKRLIPFNEIDSLKPNLALIERAEQTVSKEKKQETFYVLENKYQQLVFSNFGGALAEINLPFESETNESSVVKPVEYDRQMVEDHPYNAYFPQHPYITADKTQHEKGTLGGYYPLLRRDLIQKGERKSIRVSPQFYAFNVVSGTFSDVAELIYEVKEFTPTKIVFEAVQPHRRISKTFSIEDEKDAPYTLNLSMEITGDTRNLWLTSGVPEVEWISGGPAPALKIRETLQGKPSVTELSFPTDTQIVNGRKPDWTSNGNGFFGVIQDPLDDVGEGYAVQYVSGAAVPSRLTEIDQEHDLYPAEKMPGYITMLPLKNKSGKMDFRIFAGPFSSKVLKQVDEVYTNPEIGYNPDYIATQTFHGWFAFISEPFAKFLFILMNFFHFLTGSWGFSIILLTLALRIMLYPLNAWSTKSMLKMKEITPLVQKLQEKHKKDPKKLQIEMMNLYRDKGVNPVSGCFPILIQIPFLIGMFGLLKSTFELRGASFIPGWIDNLAAPDVVFSWGTPIPLIGNEFHLLPFLVGGVMFIQQSMMSTLPEDPKDWTDQQRQQRAMGNVMALVMVFIFYSMPSGLNIYFLFSTFFGLVQQWWMNRRMQSNQPEIIVEAAPVKRRK